MNDFPKFLRDCDAHGQDPAKLLARAAKAYKKLTPDQRKLLSTIPTRKTIVEEEEPFFPCGWCKQDNGTWNPWCGWWHWWVCGWPGFGCVDCGAEPPPE